MAKGMNPQAMLKQAQKMQAKIQAVQEEAARETVEATAGGGMVTATVYGDLRIKSIEIDPEALDPEDVEMLQDMIVAAVNDALKEMSEDGTLTALSEKYFGTDISKE